MGTPERRRHRRVPIAFVLFCRRVSPPATRFLQGRAANASTGGLYIETVGETIGAGDLVEVEMSVPPTPGVLESGGTISGRARVLRTDTSADREASNGLSAGTYGMAVEFSHPPKLKM